MRPGGIEATFGPRAAGRFGGDDERVALPDVADEAAEHPLSSAIGVHVGGVDEGSASLDERDELVFGLMLIGVATPRHGAQAKARDGQPSAAQPPLLHEVRDYPEPAPIESLAMRLARDRPKCGRRRLRVGDHDVLKSMAGTGQTAG